MSSQILPPCLVTVSETRQAISYPRCGYWTSWVSGNTVLHRVINVSTTPFLHVLWYSLCIAKRSLPDFTSEKSLSAVFHRSIVITIIVISIVTSGSNSLFPLILFLLILLFPLKYRSLPNNLRLASYQYLQEQTQDASRERQKRCAAAGKGSKPN